MLVLRLPERFSGLDKFEQPSILIGCPITCAPRSTAHFFAFNPSSTSLWMV
jgi:hypothetical protein